MSDLHPGWNNVHMIGFHDFTIRQKHHGHFRKTRQKFDQKRFPVRRLVMNNNEGQPGVRREE